MLWGGGMAGSSAICFGFLHYLDNRIAFTSLSIIIILIDGIGNATFYPATYAYAMNLFPKSSATAAAVLEGFFGLSRPWFLNRCLFI